VKVRKEANGRELVMRWPNVREGTEIRELDG
jgi:hypothetical protein